jgi:RNA polymerase-interacting CarD/CdnL/TRCF family regulator
MPNSEYTKLIGEKILSIDFGIGTISAIEKLQEDGDDFYVIGYGKENVKNYSPIKGNKKTRFPSAENDFLANIKKLKAKTEPLKFKSKKERQSYFNVALQMCEVDKIVSKILEIDSITDLIVVEKDKLNKLVKTLELEASLIYNLTAPKSQELISKYFQKEKSKK